MMLNAEVKEDGTQVAKAPKHLGDEKNCHQKFPSSGVTRNLPLLWRNTASSISSTPVLRPWRRQLYSFGCWMRKKMLLKDKRVQIAFKDEQPLRKMFSTAFSSHRNFLVIDTDLSGILLSFPEAPQSERFYVPYLNIGMIKILDGDNKGNQPARLRRRMS